MLFDCLRRHATDRPDELAVVAGDERLTWRQLEEGSRRLAAALAARGVNAGTGLAIVLPNSSEFALAVIGGLRLGSTVALIDPALSDPQVQAAVASTGCRVLVADDRRERLAGEWRDAGTITRWILRTVDDGNAGGVRGLVGGSFPPGGPRLDDPQEAWLILLTSGTTGPPSPIARTGESLERLVTTFSRTVDLTRRDRFLATASMAHAHTLYKALLAAVWSGGTLYVPGRFARRDTLRLLERERISVWPTVPFLVDLVSATAPADLRLPHLRLCISGGSSLSAATWRHARERLGIATRQMYGSTETGMIAMNLDSDTPEAAESAGRLLEGVDIAIVNEAAVPVAPGELGRIRVKTPWAATWRLTGPGTRQPLGDAAGWVDTTDLGRRDCEGRLFLAGRPTTIDVGGRKVNPGDVEAVLRRHPGVRDADVVCWRDGYGTEGVKAVVVLDGPCAPDEVLAFCRTWLADYQVPRVLEVVAAVPVRRNEPR